MYRFYTTLLVFFAASAALGAQSKTFTLLDQNTHFPIVNAHVLDSTGMVITTTDEAGLFRVNPERNSRITIRSMGYLSSTFETVDLDEVIYLVPIVFKMDKELIIEGSEEKNNIHTYQHHATHKDMDRFLDDIDGVSMIQRGAFAWEPAVRGQSDQRMNLVIDGMAVFKACVDKMDPITSYVEVNNLSKIKVDKSGSNVAENGNGNATVNIITQKARFEPFEMNLETTFQAPNQYQAYRLHASGSDSRNIHALRFSGNYKSSGNIQAGNSKEIENTQFEKLNLNLYYRYNLASNHSLELNYITDKAYDVGYPALLMDATRALADIGRLQFNFADNQQAFRFTTAVLYANTVRHSMDDYGRDVANRTVMRGMYMPMYGETRTFGTKLNGEAKIIKHDMKWFFDAFTSEAFGDMKMESLDPDIADMLVYNMDEVHTRNISLGLRQQLQLSQKLNLKLDKSVRFKSVQTTSESYASFFEGLYNRNLSPRNRVLLSGSGSLLWMINNNWSLSNTLVYSERMGNHMELFGHYVYNYTDGFFYDGNPWLDTERTINIDLNSTWKTDDHSLSFSVFTKRFFNYIDGIVFEDVSNNDFQFKQYANVGGALMMGGELRTINNIRSKFRLENRVSYLYAQNIELNEPLPLIPPLHGSFLFTYTNRNSLVGFDLDWAASQNRIATISSIEDKTDGFLIAGINFQRKWLNNDLVTILELNNLTDHYYHQHTSIGNIPQQGFNVMLTLRYRYGQK